MSSSPFQRALTCAVLVLIWTALPAPIANAGNDARLKSIIAGDHRTPKYSPRDRYRHPYETLTFLGLKPGMTVVEVWPGGGWYTEILAPYLMGAGKYYA
ncbi:MAG: methyltransferase, partial [Methyloligellaceae bacterium]